MSDAVIVAAVRSAIGKKKGALANTRADDLLALTLKALAERAKVDPAQIEDVVAGCVTQIGEQGFNVARTAALMAGFPSRRRARPSTASVARRSRRCTSPRRRSCRARSTWSRPAASSR